MNARGDPLSQRTPPKPALELSLSDAKPYRESPIGMQNKFMDFSWLIRH